MPRPDVRGRGAKGAAVRLDDLLGQLFGAVPAVSLQTWDGCRVEHGDDGIVVHVRSRKAVRRLLWAPGPLGVARAYVAGEIDVEGDLVRATEVLYDYAERLDAGVGIDPAGRREVLRTTVLLGAVGPAPRPPDVALEAVGGYAHVGAELASALSPALAERVLGGALPAEERDAAAGADERTVLHVGVPEPLSVLIAAWEKEDVEVVRVDAVRDELAATLLDRLTRLDDSWADVVAAVGETRARVWRLSLAMSRENLRRRRVLAHRVVGVRA